jgi:hypothetical protein
MASEIRGRAGSLNAVQTSAHLRDGSAHTADPWRASILIFFVTTVLSALLAVATLAAVDPYDTGRFALAPLWRGRIDEDRSSRGRDTRFNSAIIGNSRIEMVRPALLDEKTGLRFVSLYIHGAQPIEELAVLRYFLRHHPEARAIVIGLDETWCFDPLRSELKSEFPAWQYEDDTLRYLAHLYSFRVVQRAWDAWHSAESRADGFEDYEPAFHAAGADTIEVVRKKLPPARPTARYTSLNAFPAVSELEKILQDMPATIAVVLAWVPTHISMIPLPDTPEARATAACRTAYTSIASVRRRTRILDWYLDRPENRIDDAYLDRVHYRTPIATAFGQDIAAQLNAALSDR